MSGYRDLTESLKTEKLVTKERVVRRDLRNRVSPVDRAHMNRP